MKNIITCFLLLTLFCFSKCNKEKKDLEGLPPSTQDGKNTLGFLLNGQPWMPQGFSGVANLSIDFDPNINNGILGIVAYRTLSSADKTQFILGVIDSLNFKSAPFTLEVKKKSIGAISFSTKTFCDLSHYDSTVYQSGRISFSKLDRTNRIVAGAFTCVLYNQMCGDTIRITDGRFDMKF